MELCNVTLRQLFVDVKFARGTDGFVSVYLHEVSQGWHYVLLAIGFSLLFLAPVASKCLPSDYSITPEKLKLERLSGQESAKVRGYEFPSRGKKYTIVKGNLIASENGNGNCSESLW
nr:transmembrane protein 194 [Tanacetum cinerariifolium]GEZ53144.1 transmembrane protein 194 [Tanacetum cinerariifolium]